MRACMVAYTGYESDNRVRRYAESLATRGYSVDAVALRADGLPRQGVLNGVRVFRIQPRTRDEKSKFSYLAKLLLFLVRSMLFLTREHFRERYDLIHIHSVPDFEVFAAIVPKLMGAKVILDIHDILPEFYASKFKASPKSLMFKVLLAVERLSAGFCDHVIAANHLWEERLNQRSVEPSMCSTFLNYPDTRLFQRRGRKRGDHRFVILYPGSLNYHQGVDIAVRAFALIRNQVPEADFHIYGSHGDQLETVSRLVVELGLQNRVFLKSAVPFEDVPALMESADLGVVPKRDNGFGNEAFSTKILEFMTMGVPVIIPDTAIDRYYFNDSVAHFFHAGNEASLADALLLLIKDGERRRNLAQAAGEFVKAYRWDANEAAYLHLVDSLLGSTQNPRQPEMLSSAPGSSSTVIQTETRKDHSHAR